jgi:hypothetical protein
MVYADCEVRLGHHGLIFWQGLPEFSHGKIPPGKRNEMQAISLELPGEVSHGIGTTKDWIFTFASIRFPCCSIAAPFKGSALSRQRILSLLGEIQFNRTGQINSESCCVRENPQKLS